MFVKYPSGKVKEVVYKRREVVCERHEHRELLMESIHLVRELEAENEDSNI